MSQMEINKVLTQMRALSSQMGLHGTNAATPIADGANSQFGQVLAKSVSAVNDQQQVADNLITGFQTGTGTASVAEVMIAMQKASLSFTAMTQVRNKLVDAYQEIMNMPI